MIFRISLKELIEGQTKKESLEAVAAGRLIKIIPGKNSRDLDVLKRELGKRKIPYYVSNDKNNKNSEKDYTINLKQIELVY